MLLWTCLLFSLSLWVLILKTLKNKKEFQKAVEINTWAHSNAIKLPE